MIKKKDIEKLSYRIEKLEEENKKLNNNITQLNRIIKYAKNKKPTHLLQKEFDKVFYIKYRLYIYINKKEYDIGYIKELNNLYVTDSSLEYSKDYLILHVTFGDKYKEYEDFIIDYKSSKYIIRRTNDLEEDKYEK